MSLLGAECTAAVSQPPKKTARMDYGIDQWKMLLNDSGGSSYVADIGALQRNVQHALTSFRDVYPNTHLAYSYKTNYLTAFCREADRLGLCAEVVSGAEYAMALGNGVLPERIILNGPVKTRSEIERALLGAAIVNVDSCAEVEIVQSICGRYPDRSFRVGIRCSLPYQSDLASRFGFTSEDGQVHAAFKQLNDPSNCAVAGLHCHSSSDRSVSSFADRTEMILALADEIFTVAPPRYLDLGGGFRGATPNSLDLFQSDAPNFHDYAKCVASPVRERYGVDGSTRLLLEPGISVLADTMQFACEVVAVKQQGGRNIAVTTGSVHNLGPMSDRVNLPIRHLPASTLDRSGRADTWDVAGYTCMEDDILYRGLAGPVAAGDVFVFDNVGAYSLVFKPPFVRETPPVVCWDARQRAWQRLHERQPLVPEA